MKPLVQGDIFFLPVDGFEGVETVRDGVIVAHGEATGHYHEVVGNCVLKSQGQLSDHDMTEFAYGRKNIPDLHIVCRNDTPVKHQEHRTHILKQGQHYRIIRQREYDGEDWRLAQD